MRIRWRRTRSARVVRVAVGLCVALALTYLVGINVFLGTRWFRHAISFSPEELRVEYSRAYSLLPGRIHVEGLSIRGSDTSVEWILKLDSCDFHVQFLDLLHRKFHADHVRGSGVSMRIRLRLLQEDGTPEVVAAVPHIPGFSDPPYLVIGPPRPPLADAQYNLWSVQLDDVDAQHVREIWVQTMRYAGDMRVRGRWFFRPVRWLEVGPATVDVANLDVSYGLASPLLMGMHGTIEVTVHPFDVREPQGLEVLHYVSTSAHLSGREDPGELFSTFAHASSWRLAPGESPLELELFVDHGALRPGTRVATSSARSELSDADLMLSAAVKAELRVASEGDAPAARLDVGVAALQVARRGFELGRADSVSIDLTSRDLDLAHPSARSATFAVELRGASAPSVASLPPLLPTGIAVDSGLVRGDGHLEGRVEDESARGQLEFAIRALSVAHGLDQAGANVRGVLKLESGSLLEHEVELGDSHVAFEDVVAAHGTTRLFTAPLLSIHAARLHFGPGGRSGTVSVELAAAELGDLPALGERLRLPQGVTVTQGVASASLHMNADVASLSARGNANLVAHGLRVRVGSDAYQGELGIVVRASNLGDDLGTTALSGSTLSFTSAGGPTTEAWWARVSLPDARLRLGGGVHFRASVHMNAANASPVQALLARVTPVPRWMLNAFPTDNLRVDGEIRETSSSLEVRSVVAESSGTSIRLEYAKHDTDKEGVVLVSSGSLRLGVTLAGDGQKLLLFGAESWFAHRVATLRAREALMGEALALHPAMAP
jgi:hypothetical protein